MVGILNLGRFSTYAGLGKLVRMRMLAKKLNITRHSKESVTKDLEVLKRTQGFVEKKDMHHSLSRGWAHKVEGIQATPTGIVETDE